MRYLGERRLRCPTVIHSSGVVQQRRQWCMKNEMANGAAAAPPAVTVAGMSRKR